jgi:aryl-alcohol dehydrogenase-like predicted oxidoreductase
MLQRRLGRSGPLLPALGLGCMGMSGSYGPGDERESFATIDRALELGVTLLDTADMYGIGHNERLIGRALRGRRDRVFLATKFGMVRTQDPSFRAISGKPEYVRSACDASLQRLGIDTIDLYYQHRVDPEVPIEETVGAMAGLVQAGKVRYLGLSEARADEVRRAVGVHPILAYQGEYSLFSRDHEDNGVAATIRDLGIGWVCYSPVGRGWLSGTLRAFEDFAPNDMRRDAPRWNGENFARNQALAATVVALAGELGITPAQLALAWILARRDDVIPIPGTKRVAHLEENVAALDVQLTPAQLARIEAAIPKGSAAGARRMGGTATPQWPFLRLRRKRRRRGTSRRHHDRPRTDGQRAPAGGERGRRLRRPRDRGGAVPADGGRSRRTEPGGQRRAHVSRDDRVAPARRLR